MANKKKPINPVDPEHYKGRIEVIDVIEAFDLNYRLGNVVKYILRHAKKDGVQDLRKAENYLHREITGVWVGEETTDEV